MYGNIGIACASSTTICHCSSVQNWRYLIHAKEGLRSRVLPWQNRSRYHFASFLTFIAGDKFDWQHLNISRGQSVNFVIYLLT